MAQVINFDGGITKSEVEVLISGSTAGKQDTDSVRAVHFFNTHPTLQGKYLFDYHIEEIADWADYLAWLDNAWSNIGISGKLAVPWAADEMVDIIAYDPTEEIGGLLKVIRNGLVYLFETTGEVSWTIMQLATGDANTEEIELSLAAIVNDLNDRKQDKTAMADFYTKEQIDAMINDINNRITQLHS